MDNLTAYSRPWQTVPNEDLEIHEDQEQTEDDHQVNGLAWLEVRQAHPLLKENGQVVVAPWNSDSVEKVYKQSTEGVTPILIYAISKDVLSDQVRPVVTTYLDLDKDSMLHILKCKISREK